MKVALVQMDIVWENSKANRERRIVTWRSA